MFKPPSSGPAPLRQVTSKRAAAKDWTGRYHILYMYYTYVLYIYTYCYIIIIIIITIMFILPCLRTGTPTGRSSESRPRIPDRPSRRRHLFLVCFVVCVCVFSFFHVRFSCYFVFCFRFCFIVTQHIIFKGFVFNYFHWLSVCLGFSYFFFGLLVYFFHTCLFDISCLYILFVLLFLGFLCFYSISFYVFFFFLIL